MQIKYEWLSILISSSESSKSKGIHNINNMKTITILSYQVEAAFKRFDQTGNEKLNFKEFSDMMTKRADGGKGESRRARPQQEAGDSAAVSSEPNKD